MARRPTGANPTKTKAHYKKARNNVRLQYDHAPKKEQAEKLHVLHCKTAQTWLLEFHFGDKSEPDTAEDSTHEMTLSHYLGNPSKRNAT